jgi:hypothetical protein
MGGTCSICGEEEEDRCIKVFVGKPERKKPLGRPRYRREYNIKINL